MSRFDELIIVRVEQSVAVLEAMFLLKSQREEDNNGRKTKHESESELVSHS